MAHFAKIDENNVVLEVVIVGNEHMIDESTGQESEQKGIDFIKNRPELYPNSSPTDVWIQASYNGNIRNIYPPVGGIYNPDLDVFLYSKPYDSWILDEATLNWKSPIPNPNDNRTSADELPWYLWDESSQSWIAQYTF